MPIVPDTKDWTWAAEQRCAACGFDPARIAREDISHVLRRTAQAWVSFLGGDRAWRARPDDSTWSPVEYAAHVRDVITLYDERLQLMLSTEDPLFANWDQDAAATGYLDEEPAVIAKAIACDSAALAARFESVSDWGRPGRRSDGAQFTIESFGRYFLHDVIHHAHDVGA